MHGRYPGPGKGIHFTRTLRGVTRGLRKLYPVTSMVRVPLLVVYMRAIRGVMNMNNLKDVTYWALWASQWQAFIRGSDILR